MNINTGRTKMTVHDGDKVVVELAWARSEDHLIRRRISETSVKHVIEWAQCEAHKLGWGRPEWNREFEVRITNFNIGLTAKYNLNGIRIG